MEAKAAAKTAALKPQVKNSLEVAPTDFFRVCSLRTTFGQAATSLAQWEALKPLDCVNTGDHRSSICSALETFPDSQIISGDMSQIDIMIDRRTRYEKVTKSMRDLPYVRLKEGLSNGGTFQNWIPYAFRNKREYSTEENAELARQLYGTPIGCLFNANKDNLYGVDGQIAGPLLFTRSRLSEELAYIKETTGVDYQTWSGTVEAGFSSRTIGRIHCNSYRPITGCSGSCPVDPYLYKCQKPTAGYDDAFATNPAGWPERVRRFANPTKIPQSAAGNVNEPATAYRLLVPKMTCWFGSASSRVDNLLEPTGQYPMLDMFATFLDAFSDVQSPGYGKTYNLPQNVKTWLGNKVTTEPNSCYVDLSDNAGTTDPLDGFYMPKKFGGVKVSYVTRSQIKNEMCSNPQCKYLGTGGAFFSDPEITLNQADTLVRGDFASNNPDWDVVYWTTSTSAMFTDVAAWT
eukprot:2358330-Rhodomonas_salina.1